MHAQLPYLPVLLVPGYGVCNTLSIPDQTIMTRVNAAGMACGGAGSPLEDHERLVAQGLHLQGPQSSEHLDDGLPKFRPVPLHYLMIVDAQTSTMPVLLPCKHASPRA